MSTNQIQLASYIKNLGNDQLQQVMQQPPPGVPLYLIMSEAQRRQELMQKSMGGQAQPPTTTVAQDIQSGIAGTPQMSQGGLPPTDPAAQQGLGSFAAPPQAPQPPMPQQGMEQQGQMPPQGFAEGGEVDAKKWYQFGENRSADRNRERSERAREKMKKSRDNDPYLPKGVYKTLGLDKLQKEGAAIGDKINVKGLLKEFSHIGDRLKDGISSLTPDAVAGTPVKEEDMELLWPHTPASSEENPWGGVEDPQSAGLGSLGAPSTATPSYAPRGPKMGDYGYTRPNFDGLSMPEMPEQANDEDFLRQVNEKYSSGVFDEHMGRVDERLGGLDQDRSRAGSDALMKAGFAMMAGDSPHGSVNIGKGAGVGFDHLNEREEAIRARQDKLEERREMLQLAKIEFERGNHEMAYKMADRANRLGKEAYEMQTERFKTERSIREDEAKYSNEEASWDFAQDKYRNDFGQQERRIAASASRGGIGGGAEYTATQINQAHRLFDSAVKAEFDALKDSLNPEDMQIKLQGADAMKAAAKRKAIAALSVEKPLVVEILRSTGSQVGSSASPAAAGAQSSAPMLDYTKLMPNGKAQ